MALDATVGGATANSYVSQSTATAYFSDRLDAAAWVDASIGEKDAALIMATRRLDIESFTGIIATTTQALQWPRYSVIDRNGILLSSSSIPQALQQATFELALALLREPTLLEGSGLEEFRDISIPSLSLTTTSNIPTLPVFVRQLLLGLRIGGIMSTVQRA